MKSRIAMILAIVYSITGNIFAIENKLTPSSDVDCSKIYDLKNYEINQVEELINVEIQKSIETATNEGEIIEEIIKEPHYNPYNLLEPSNITREQAYEILEGTSLQALSNGYVYMEEVYGINSLFLMALSAEESGWGNSQLARTHNNIGGIKAASGNWAYFDDWFQCLAYKADLLYNEYLSDDGIYHNGYSIWSINKRYCEQKIWSGNLNSIAYGLLSKLIE